MVGETLLYPTDGRFGHVRLGPSHFEHSAGEQTPSSPSGAITLTSRAFLETEDAQTSKAGRCEHVVRGHTLSRQAHDSHLLWWLKIKP